MACTCGECKRCRATARTLVYWAVRVGRLVRPTVCERCGRGGRIEGHHHDYREPLDVEWLCKACHVGEHWNGPGPHTTLEDVVQALSDLKEANDLIKDELQALAPEERKQAIRDCIAAGVSQSELAGMLGLSRQRISQLAKS